MDIEHVAIIMDGNGRWAERRGLPRVEGHRKGVEAARAAVKSARRMGLGHLTLYALSTENLFRPEEEVQALNHLMNLYLDTEVESLIENGIRLKVIGDPGLLSKTLAAKVKSAEDRTEEAGFEMTLNLAVCYGGRDEIVRAARRLSSKMDMSEVTEADFKSALDASHSPDPDLMIRTGGDFRISNFLLWELAYAELYFSRVLWPDFTGRHLKRAIDSFARRERRFGRRPGEKSKPEKPGKTRILE